MFNVYYYYIKCLTAAAIYNMHRELYIQIERLHLIEMFLQQSDAGLIALASSSTTLFQYEIKKMR